MRARWVIGLLWLCGATGCDDGGAASGGDAAAVGDGALDRAPDGDQGVETVDGGDGAGGDGAGGDGPSDGPSADGGTGEPVEVAPCVETVRVGALEVFAHEASHPDADATSAGVDGSKPCSRAGVLPWTGVSWPDASRVCLGAGFRLCTNDEWQRACGGEARGWFFPYATRHLPGRCNDHVSGAGMMSPTGAFADCRTPEGAYDLSGNAWELTADGARRGASWKINAVMFRVDAARCDTWYDVAEGFADDDVGFRCCR